MDIDIDIEIKEIIDDLKLKSGGNDINASKLFQIFKQAELNYDKADVSDEIELFRFKKIIGEKQPRPRLIHKNKIFRRPSVLIPAAAVIVLCLTFIFDWGVFKKPVNYGKVVSVGGDVKIVRNNNILLLRTGDHIGGHDKIISGDKSFADITFAETVKFRILANSSMNFNFLKIFDEKISFDVFLKKGGLLFDVTKLNTGDLISIKTPVSEAVVRGTKFGVKINDENKTLYEVYEGKIKVRKRIDLKNFNLDKSLLKDLEIYLSDQSAIVDENKSCTISVNKGQFKKLTVGNFQNKLKDISLLEVTMSSPAKFQTNEVMASFLSRGNKIKSKEKQLSSNVNVVKPVASSHNNNENKSLYVIYDPVMKLLISVNQNGLIEATDFKYLKWTNRISGRILSKPIIDNKNIYISSNKNDIIAFSLKNGMIKWKKRIYSDSGIKNIIFMKLDKNSLYAAAADGRLYKLAKNGKIIWMLNLEEKIETAPVLSGKLIFLAIKGGKLLGIGKRHGLKVMKLNLESSIMSMEISKGNILIGTSNGNIIFYSYKKDEIIWKHFISKMIIKYVIFNKKAIYVFNNRGIIYKLNYHNEIEWKSDIGNNITKRPAHDIENILIATDNVFYVINKSNGLIKWSVVMPEIISKNVTISKDHIYFVLNKKGITTLKKHKSL